MPRIEFFNIDKALNYHVDPNGAYIDSKLPANARKIIRITYHSRSTTTGSCGYQNFPLNEPLRVDGKEIYPIGFDLALLSTEPGIDTKLQEVDIPVSEESRLTCRVNAPAHSAYCVDLTLTLEMAE